MTGKSAPLDVQGTLKAALAHHQAGRLPKAETLYRQILARHPQHPDALHFLGLLAHHAGQHEAAVGLISQAITLTPGHAACHINLGSAFNALGRFDEAVASYRHALSLQPDLYEAHLNLGNTLQARGQLSEAAASYRRALALQPGNALGHYNLGNVLHTEGQLDEAVASFQRALKIRPTYVEAHNNLGNVRKAQGLLDEAARCYQQAAVASPDYAVTHNNLGLLAMARGETDEAIAHFRRALAIHPDFAETLNNLGAQLEIKGDLDQAILCYRRALVLNPDYAVAHSNLGNALQTLGHLDESMASYRRALDLKPDYAEARNNLGLLYLAHCELDDAIACYDQALALKPDYAYAAWNKAFALLLTGDYATGWALHESRNKLPNWVPALRAGAQPLWLGEGPGGSSLAGQTLLVHHEQGYGDTLQMLRYVPLLAARGARVIVRVPPSLTRIVASVPGVSEVIDEAVEPPPFELHCPFMSLPLAFRTRVESIPVNVPYLHADERASSAWQTRLGARTSGLQRVGLAWSGSAAHKNDHNRSIGLDQLLPAFAEASNHRVELHSLQKEYRGSDQAQFAADGRIRDHSAELGDFADTAALIMQLDLVITVDTAVAHLAGGLGKPVWLLLPFSPDYRWLLGRADSPWYPGMRLFRQPAHGDWASVIRAVAMACRETFEAAASR